jgi:hypothetical protein
LVTLIEGETVGFVFEAGCMHEYAHIGFAARHSRTTQRSYRSSDFRRDIADGLQNGRRSEVRRQIIDWCRFD